MKKIIGTVTSLLFLIFGTYCLTIIAANVCISDTARLSIFGVFVIILQYLSILFSAGLVLYSFTHSRFGRLNLDIFSTIILFFTFMLSFLLPGDLLRGFANVPHPFGFGSLNDLILRLCIKGLGVYEVFLFLAMIAMGLTIGEGKRDLE